MRLFFVSRKLDQSSDFAEAELLQITSKFFGTKFNQKQDLISKEACSESGKVAMCVMAQICWPLQLSNPLKQQQVVHPFLISSGIGSLIEAYEQSHKNRKVQVIALFGQVELCLDKKFHFKLSTGQASLLLRIADVGSATL